MSDVQAVYLGAVSGACFGLILGLPFVFHAWRAVTLMTPPKPPPYPFPPSYLADANSKNPTTEGTAA